MKSTLLRKILSIVTAVTFSVSSLCGPVAAQTVLNLPMPGTMVSPTQSYLPTVLKGVQINPDNPLQFDFLIDRGDDMLEDESFKAESTKLIKYFLAALTIPEDQMWVNLSPYEKDRIIPDEFGATEMGRDLLAQDYMLKQLSSSLMYPEHELGKKFWERVQKQTKEQYGTTELPANALNKIWIVPEESKIYEHAKGAFIVESRLKVLMEEDYEGLRRGDLHGRQNNQATTRVASTSPSTEILREILIPEIEREVNEGAIFANLRQIYNSMLLATWYKNKLKDSLLGKAYVDKAKVDGVNIDDPKINQKIYDQYIAAFKQGAYDFIKDEYDPETQDIIPRKYFSGGAMLNASSAMTKANQREVEDEAMKVADRVALIEADFAMAAKPNSPKGFLQEVLVNDNLRQRLLSEQGVAKGDVFAFIDGIKIRNEAKNLLDLLTAIGILQVIRKEGAISFYGFTEWIRKIIEVGDDLILRKIVEALNGIDYEISGTQFMERIIVKSASERLKMREKVTQAIAPFDPENNILRSIMQERFETLKASVRNIGVVVDIHDIDGNLTTFGKKDYGPAGVRTNKDVDPEAYEMILAKLQADPNKVIVLPTGRFHALTEEQKKMSAEEDVLIVKKEFHALLESKGIKGQDREEVLKRLFFLAENVVGKMTNGFNEDEDGLYEEYDHDALFKAAGRKVEFDHEHDQRVIEHLNELPVGEGVMKVPGERFYKVKAKTGEEVQALRDQVITSLREAGLWKEEQMDIKIAGGAVEVLLYRVDKSVVDEFVEHVLGIPVNEDTVEISTGNSTGPLGNDAPVVNGRGKPGGLSSEKYDPLDPFAIALVLISGKEKGWPTLQWALEELESAAMTAKQTKAPDAAMNVFGQLTAEEFRQVLVQREDIYRLDSDGQLIGDDLVLEGFDPQMLEIKKEGIDLAKMIVIIDFDPDSEEDTAKAFKIAQAIKEYKSQTYVVTREVRRELLSESPKNNKLKWSDVADAYVFSGIEIEGMAINLNTLDTPKMLYMSNTILDGILALDRVNIESKGNVVLGRLDATHINVVNVSNIAKAIWLTNGAQDAKTHLIAWIGLDGNVNLKTGFSSEFYSLKDGEGADVQLFTPSSQVPLNETAHIRREGNQLIIEGDFEVYENVVIPVREINTAKRISVDINGQTYVVLLELNDEKIAFLDSSRIPTGNMMGQADPIQRFWLNYIDGLGLVIAEGEKNNHAPLIVTIEDVDAMTEKQLPFWEGTISSSESWKTELYYLMIRHRAEFVVNQVLDESAYADAVQRGAVDDSGEDEPQGFSLSGLGGVPGLTQVYFSEEVQDVLSEELVEMTEPVSPELPGEVELLHSGLSDYPELSNEISGIDPKKPIKVFIRKVAGLNAKALVVVQDSVAAAMMVQQIKAVKGEKVESILKREAEIFIPANSSVNLTLQVVDESGSIVDEAKPQSYSIVREGTKQWKTVMAGGAFKVPVGPYTLEAEPLSGKRAWMKVRYVEGSLSFSSIKNPEKHRLQLTMEATEYKPPLAPVKLAHFVAHHQGEVSFEGLRQAIIGLSQKHSATHILPRFLNKDQFGTITAIQVSPDFLEEIRIDQEELKNDLDGYPGLTQRKGFDVYVGEFGDGSKRMIIITDRERTSYSNLRGGAAAMTAAFMQEFLPQNLKTGLAAETERLREAPEPEKLKLVHLSPKTLGKASQEVQKGMQEAGLPVEDTVHIDTEENPETFANQVEAEMQGADVVVLEVHGAGHEKRIMEEVLKKKFHGKLIVMVRRPEEIILRIKKEESFTTEEEAERELAKRLSRADAVVTLGRAPTERYQKMFPEKSVVSIFRPYVDAQPLPEDRSRYNPNSVVAVGSNTTWGEMREIEDVEAVMQEINKRVNAFGYVAGNFQPAHVNMKKYLDRKKSDVVFLSNQDIINAQEGGLFSDEASFRNWLYKDVSENGKRLIIRADIADSEFRKVDFEDEELGGDVQQWEGRLIDFNLQLYKENLADQRDEQKTLADPKAEYSRTLHRGRPEIFLVLDSPTMDDVANDEGLQMIHVTSDGKKLNFKTAADELVELVQDRERRLRVLDENFLVAKNNGVKNAAYGFYLLSKFLLAENPAAETAADVLSAAMTAAQAIGASYQTMPHRARIKLAQTQTRSLLTFMKDSDMRWEFTDEENGILIMNGEGQLLSLTEDRKKQLGIVKTARYGEGYSFVYVTVTAEVFAQLKRIANVPQISSRARRIATNVTANTRERLSQLSQEHNVRHIFTSVLKPEEFSGKREISPMSIKAIHTSRRGIVSNSIIHSGADPGVWAKSHDVYIVNDPTISQHPFLVLVDTADEMLEAMPIKSVEVVTDGIKRRYTKVSYVEVYMIIEETRAQIREQMRMGLERDRRLQEKIEHNLDALRLVPALLRKGQEIIFRVDQFGFVDLEDVLRRADTVAAKGINQAVTKVVGEIARELFIDFDVSVQENGDAFVVTVIQNERGEAPIFPSILKAQIDTIASRLNEELGVELHLQIAPVSGGEYNFRFTISSAAMTITGDLTESAAMMTERGINRAVTKVVAEIVRHLFIDFDVRVRKEGDAFVITAIQNDRGEAVILSSFLRAQVDTIVDRLSAELGIPLRLKTVPGDGEYDFRFIVSSSTSFESGESIRGNITNKGKSSQVIELEDERLNPKQIESGWGQWRKLVLTYDGDKQASVWFRLSKTYNAWQMRSPHLEISEQLGERGSHFEIELEGGGKIFVGGHPKRKLMISATFEEEASISYEITEENRSSRKGEIFYDLKKRLENDIGLNDYNRMEVKFNGESLGIYQQGDNEALEVINALEQIVEDSYSDDTQFNYEYFSFGKSVVITIDAAMVLIPYEVDSIDVEKGFTLRDIVKVERLSESFIQMVNPGVDMDAPVENNQSFTLYSGDILNAIDQLADEEVLPEVEVLFFDNSSFWTSSNLELPDDELARIHRADIYNPDEENLMPLKYRMHEAKVKLLTKYLQSGRIAVFVSGDNAIDLHWRITADIPKELRHRILLAHSAGAQVFGYEKVTGQIQKEPILNLLDEYYESEGIDKEEFGVKLLSVFEEARTFFDFNAEEIDGIPVPKVRLDINYDSLEYHQGSPVGVTFGFTQRRDYIEKMGDGDRKKVYEAINAKIRELNAVSPDAQIPELPLDEKIPDFGKPLEAFLKFKYGLASLKGGTTLADHLEFLDHPSFDFLDTSPKAISKKRVTTALINRGILEVRLGHKVDGSKTVAGEDSVKTLGYLLDGISESELSKIDNPNQAHGILVPKKSAEPNHPSILAHKDRVTIVNDMFGPELLGVTYYIIAQSLLAKQPSAAMKASSLLTVLVFVVVLGVLGVQGLEYLQNRQIKDSLDDISERVGKVEGIVADMKARDEQAEEGLSEEDQLEEGLAGVNERFAGVEEGVSEVNERLKALEKYLEHVSGLFDQQDVKNAELIKAEMAELETEIVKLKGMISKPHFMLLSTMLESEIEFIRDKIRNQDEWNQARDSLGHIEGEINEAPLIDEHQVELRELLEVAQEALEKRAKGKLKPAPEEAPEEDQAMSVSVKAALWLIGLVALQTFSGRYLWPGVFRPSDGIQNYDRREFQERLNKIFENGGLPLAEESESNDSAMGAVVGSYSLIVAGLIIFEAWLRNYLEQKFKKKAIAKAPKALIPDKEVSSYSEEKSTKELLDVGTGGDLYITLFRSEDDRRYITRFEGPMLGGFNRMVTRVDLPGDFYPHNGTLPTQVRNRYRLDRPFTNQHKYDGGFLLSEFYPWSGVTIHHYFGSLENLNGRKNPIWEFTDTEVGNRSQDKLEKILERKDAAMLQGLEVIDFMISYYGALEEEASRRRFTKKEAEYRDKKEEWVRAREEALRQSKQEQKASAAMTFTFMGVESPVDIEEDLDRERDFWAGPSRPDPYYPEERSFSIWSRHTKGVIRTKFHDNRIRVDSEDFVLNVSSLAQEFKPNKDNQIELEVVYESVSPNPSPPRRAILRSEVIMPTYSVQFLNESEKSNPPVLYGNTQPFIKRVYIKDSRTGLRMNVVLPNRQVFGSGLSVNELWLDEWHVPRRVKSHEDKLRLTLRYFGIDSRSGKFISRWLDVDIPFEGYTADFHFSNWLKSSPAMVTDSTASAAMTAKEAIKQAHANQWRIFIKRKDGESEEEERVDTGVVHSVSASGEQFQLDEEEDPIDIDSILMIRKIGDSDALYQKDAVLDQTSLTPPTSLVERLIEESSLTEKNATFRRTISPDEKSKVFIEVNRPGEHYTVVLDLERSSEGEWVEPHTGMVRSFARNPSAIAKLTELDTSNVEPGSWLKLGQDPGDLSNRFSEYEQKMEIEKDESSKAFRVSGLDGVVISGNAEGELVIELTEDDTDIVVKKRPHYDLDTARALIDETINTFLNQVKDPTGRLDIAYTVGSSGIITLFVGVRALDLGNLRDTAYEQFEVNMPFGKEFYHFLNRRLLFTYNDYDPSKTKNVHSGKYWIKFNSIAYDTESAAMGAKPTRSAAMAVKRSDIKVIIIEDDDDYRRLIEGPYARGGYNIVGSFKTAEEALKFLDGESSLGYFIQTDLKLPEMDGDEFVRQLLERGFTPDQFLIFSSEVEEELARVRSILPGVDVVAKQHRMRHVMEHFVNKKFPQSAAMTGGASNERERLEQQVMDVLDKVREIKEKMDAHKRKGINPDEFRAFVLSSGEITPEELDARVEDLHGNFLSATGVLETAIAAIGTNLETALSPEFTEMERLLPLLIASGDLQINYDKLIEYSEFLDWLYDRAMTTKGGIDLNQTFGTMEVQKEGEGVVMPEVSQEMLDAAMNATGFVPVIRDVNMSIGVQGLFLLLGLKEEEDNGVAVAAI